MELRGLCIKGDQYFYNIYRLVLGDT